MINQFRTKTKEELYKLVDEWKSELLALRFQQVTGKLEKSHKFSELKLAIARALTIISEKEKNINSNLVEQAKKGQLKPGKRLLDKIGIGSLINKEDESQPAKEELKPEPQKVQASVKPEFKENKDSHKPNVKTAPKTSIKEESKPKAPTINKEIKKEPEGGK